MTKKKIVHGERFLKRLSNVAKQRRSKFLEKTLEKIVVLRNNGMKAGNIGTYLGVDKNMVYRHTCGAPAYFLSEELGEMILAALALNLNLAEYILLMHSSWGVKHVKKFGDPELKARMFELAAEKN